MKILVISGSRSDRNGLSYLSDQFVAAGHKSTLIEPRGSLYRPIDAGLVAHEVGKLISDSGGARGWLREAAGEFPDLAVIGGDRYETLASAFACSIAGVPIAHLAGGDQTLGSIDDRYRDAITALACVHLATNEKAFVRLKTLAHPSDLIAWTGSPAVDFIMRTPILSRAEVRQAIGLTENRMITVVCVHPNTVGKDPLFEFWAIKEAIKMSVSVSSVVWLGSNNDVGGSLIDAQAKEFCNELFYDSKFVSNLPPQIYFSLLANAAVLVGNSSAGYYEAPSLGVPVVDVGDRQEGRVKFDKLYRARADADHIKLMMEYAMRGGRYEGRNPYGDGSAAREIIKSLEMMHFPEKSLDRIGA